MTICSLCKKKFSFWNSCYIEGDSKEYCPDCYKNKKKEIEKLNIKEKEKEENKAKEIKEEMSKVMEYKRKCNQCGKVWHSLVKEERMLGRNVLFDSLISVGTAIEGNIGASTQASRNTDANRSSLSNLKKCPNCGSADYTEEIISFKKKF